MQALYHSALVLHIIGLTMMAGTTLVDYRLYQHLWQQLTKDRAEALALSKALQKVAALFGIGIILLIISGVTMMGITNGVFGEQVWFRIKFALVILIIINGLAFGRRQGIKLRKNLVSDIPFKEESVLHLKSRLKLFHLSQLLLFVTIFVLSVFKFN